MERPTPRPPGPDDYQPNPGRAWRHLSPPAWAFYALALAKLEERHPDRGAVIRERAALVAETGLGTAGRAAYEEAFACARPHARQLFLSPPFFRLWYYPATGVETAAFTLMHESYHLELDFRFQDFYSRERRAYRRGWSHKRDFGFFERPATYWRDITEHTDFFTALLPNPFGRSLLSAVTAAEWEWAHR